MIGPKQTPLTWARKFAHDPNALAVVQPGRDLFDLVQIIVHRDDSLGVTVSQLVLSLLYCVHWVASGHCETGPCKSMEGDAIFRQIVAATYMFQAET